MKQKDNDDHRTPTDLFNNLNHRFGPFDLDAAANDINFLCKNYFTKENSGLSNEWKFEKVWINPPYSNLKKWVEKAIREIDLGNCRQVVMLLPVDTSSIAWGRYVYDRASEIYFINKRLKFHGPNEVEGMSSPRSNAVVVFRKNIDVGTSANIWRKFQYMTSKGIILYPSTSLDNFTVSNRG
jgi:phage N-6-adenine-methyltransferase